MGKEPSNAESSTYSRWYFAVWFTVAGLENQLQQYIRPKTTSSTYTRCYYSAQRKNSIVPAMTQNDQICF